MIPLLTLAVIGGVAGGVGGALTNGVDGFVLGGCAGFVLGVAAWVTENTATQQAQELHPDQLMTEFQRTVPPGYEQSTTRQQQHNERGYSP